MRESQALIYSPCYKRRRVRVPCQNMQKHNSTEDNPAAKVTSPVLPTSAYIANEDLKERETDVYGPLVERCAMEFFFLLATPGGQVLLLVWVYVVSSVFGPTTKL